MKSHTIDDCISCLELQRHAEQFPKAFDVLKGFEESGLDPLLGTFCSILQRDDIPHVLSFLRTFSVLDVSDCERISNKCVNQTTQEEIMAMVNILNTKGPHAYWFTVHSMERLNQEFFSQMHGKIVCCICKEVKENYDLVVQKEAEKEDVTPPEQSNQSSGQRETVTDLMGRVEQLRASFSSLENNITEMLERVKPFPRMMENLSQRFRDEIKDVMTHTDADGEIGGHTNVNVIKRLKEKCSRLRRQIESRLHSISRIVQVNIDEDEMKTGELKEVVCKEPKPTEDSACEDKQLIPHRTYEDLWIEFEDRCYEKFSHYNPFTAIQKSLGDVLVLGLKNKGKVCCAIGIAVCVKVVCSYLIEYSEWTEGPRPMFT